MRLGERKGARKVKKKAYRKDVQKVGRAEGSKDERSKIAINLIRLGASCEIIAQATGLSEEEVSWLKERSEPK